MFFLNQVCQNGCLYEGLCMLGLLTRGRLQCDPCRDLDWVGHPGRKREGGQSPTVVLQHNEMLYTYWILEEFKMYFDLFNTFLI